MRQIIVAKKHKKHKELNKPWCFWCLFAALSPASVEAVELEADGTGAGCLQAIKNANHFTVR
jgi:hypothetical protein